MIDDDEYCRRLDRCISKEPAHGRVLAVEYIDLVQLSSRYGFLLNQFEYDDENKWATLHTSRGLLVSVKRSHYDPLNSSEEKHGCTAWPKIVLAMPNAVHFVGVAYLDGWNLSLCPWVSISRKEKEIVFCTNKRSEHE